CGAGGGDAGAVQPGAVQPRPPRARVGPAALGAEERPYRHRLQPARPGPTLRALPGSGAEQLPAPAVGLPDGRARTPRAPDLRAREHRLSPSGDRRAGGPRVADRQAQRGRHPGRVQPAAGGGERGGRRPRADGRRGGAAKHADSAAGGGVMRLEAVELRRIGMPLVAPFETSFGVQSERDILLVKAITSGGEGWGECVAGEEPTYSPEYVDGAQHVLAHHLLPRLFGRE